MLSVSDEQFDEFISEAMDELPDQYIKRLDNVLITYEDEPLDEQRNKLKLRCDQTLFGLYEGIPLTKRNAAYNLVLPDKITLFKLPLFYSSADIDDFKRKIKHTLWHEVAHYYGLGHDRIHEIESKWKQ